MKKILFVCIVILCTAVYSAENEERRDGSLPWNSRDPLIQVKGCLNSGGPKKFGYFDQLPLTLPEGNNLLVDADSFPRKPGRLVGSPSITKDGDAYRIAVRSGFV